MGAEGLVRYDVSGLCWQWGTGVLLLGLRAVGVVYKGMMIAFEKERVVDLMTLCSGVSHSDVPDTETCCNHSLRCTNYS